MTPESTLQRSLRIAVVTETFPPEVNGVARTIGAMVEGLLARGHRVQLVRPRQGRDDVPSADQDLEVILRPGMPIPTYRELRMGLPSRRALQRIWKLRRPHVVQVVTEGPLGASALAAARALEIPAASEFHTNFDGYSGHYGFGLMKGVVAAYLRRLHNRGDLTMVPTNAVAQRLEGEGYQRLRVVGRGIDMTLFGPEHRSEELRRSWGAAPGDVVAVYVGRLAPEKNLGLFIAAVRAMRAASARVRGVIVGDGPERSALLAAGPELVFAGTRAGADLASHYASADVFVFPSMTETFGNATTEAMASGLAVVAYDYAAAGQHLRHGESGLLAPFGEAREFIALAQDAAINAALRERLGNGAYAIARTLSWERVIEDLESVLGELAARAPAPRLATAGSLSHQADHAPL